MTLERKFAYFASHKPAFALTLSERASSYSNSLSCPIHPDGFE